MKYFKNYSIIKKNMWMVRFHLWQYTASVLSSRQHTTRRLAVVEWSSILCLGRQLVYHWCTAAGWISTMLQYCGVGNLHGFLCVRGGLLLVVAVGSAISSTSLLRSSNIIITNLSILISMLKYLRICHLKILIQEKIVRAPNNTN